MSFLLKLIIINIGGSLCLAMKAGRLGAESLLSRLGYSDTNIFLVLTTLNCHLNYFWQNFIAYFRVQDRVGFLVVAKPRSS